MKYALIAGAVLASLVATAHSQTSPRAAAQQATGRGTALLDRLGICAGQPVHAPAEAKVKNASLKQAASDPCAGLPN